MSNKFEQHKDWLLWNWNSQEISEKTPEERSWWEFWKIDESKKKELNIICRYLIEAVDDFVSIAKEEGEVDTHRGTIISIMSSVYDEVVAGAEIPWWIKPFWIKPFKSAVKNIIVNIFITALVDFMIRKLTSSDVES